MRLWVELIAVEAIELFVELAGMELVELLGELILGVFGWEVLGGLTKGFFWIWLGLELRLERLEEVKLEDEGELILGFREENSGFSWLCKVEGIEMIGKRLKDLCNSSKASTNFMAIAKH